MAKKLSHVELLISKAESARAFQLILMIIVDCVILQMLSMVVRRYVEAPTLVL
jgi:hypothetical protein